MKPKPLSTGTLILAALVVWAIIGKQGWDGHVVSGLGWFYDWVINPVCGAILWALHLVGAR